MPLPPDAVYAPEGTDLSEDPLGLFPSEAQKVPSEIRKVPSEMPKVFPDPVALHSEAEQRTERTFGRRFVVLTIASVVRVLAVLMAASRGVRRVAFAACVLVASAIRRLRLPRWRLPAWRPPRFNWHLRAWHVPKRPASRLHLRAWRRPEWHLPVPRLAAWRALAARVGSATRPFVTHVAARTPKSAVTLSAFALGLVVGGSAVWLSGTSRNAAVTATELQQPSRDDLHAAASPIAPVGTASASTPAVEGGQSHAAATTASANVRRRSFQGSLVVNSRPAGARVFLNGRSVGETPLVLRNQPAGSRAVRVALDGYEPWSSAVQVVADTETRLRAELKMQRPVAQP